MDVPQLPFALELGLFNCRSEVPGLQTQQNPGAEQASTGIKSLTEYGH